MITGEQLSAYLAGELDAEERAAVEDALDRDPDLRAQLERLRDADEALRSLPAVTPPAGFSERLHSALDAEMSSTDRGDELARRRQRTQAFRPLAVAAAAAAVIALFGVAGVWLMQGGGGDRAGDGAAAPMAADGAGTRIPIAVTDNDFDEQQLRRLAVNVDISGLVSRDLEAENATPLAGELQSELLTLSAQDAAAQDAPEVTAESQNRDAEDREGAETARAPTPVEDRVEDRVEDVVAECLPTVLEDARSPLLPVYVELARFDGEPAVIYTLVSEDPDSGTYRRVEVWALARADCQVLSFAQYDRE